MARDQYADTAAGQVELARWRPREAVKSGFV
jgi:hypothetical protein